MIYKDARAGEDTERCPANRRSVCLNCNSFWESHSGWACPDINISARFSDCPSQHRYLTQEMKNSIIPAKSYPLSKVSKTDDSSDWRAWATNGLQPGECICRIPREKCDYHR